MSLKLARGHVNYEDRSAPYACSSTRYETLGPFDPARWQRWRDSVPYSDARIVMTLRKMAARMQREGHAESAAIHVQMADRLNLTKRLTKKMLSYVMGELVTTCGLCGKPATWRYGNVGRCRAHKDHQPESFKALRARMDEKGRHISESQQAIVVLQAKRIARRRAVNLGGRK